MKEEILVYCGPMYSGKSNWLLLEIDTLKYANIPFTIFKPSMDRYQDEIGSRYRDAKEKAIGISKDNPREVFNHIDLSNIKLPYTVAFDETQFFSDDLYDVVKELNQKGVRVVIAGLDLDAWCKPFGVMPKLLAIATKVVKLTSVCRYCKVEGTKSAYSAPKDSENNIKVGEEDEFFPLCSACFHKYMEGK